MDTMGRDNAGEAKSKTPVWIFFFKFIVFNYVDIIMVKIIMFYFLLKVQKGNAIKCLKEHGKNVLFVVSGWL